MFSAADTLAYLPQISEAALLLTGSLMVWQRGPGGALRGVAMLSA